MSADNERVASVVAVPGLLGNSAPTRLIAVTTWGRIWQMDTDAGVARGTWRWNKSDWPDVPLGGQE